LQVVPYTCSKPVSILYTENSFILRPVPDAVYRVEVSTSKRPSYLLTADTMPELAEWSQYIAYGASIKLLQDRLDMDAVAMLTPEFKNQEMLINRRKIIQNAQKRVATIYMNNGNINPFTF